MPSPEETAERARAEAYVEQAKRREAFRRGLEAALAGDEDRRKALEEKTAALR